MNFNLKAWMFYAFDRGEVGLEFEGILGDDDYDHDDGLQAWINNDPYLQWGSNRGRGRQRGALNLDPPW